MNNEAVGYGERLWARRGTILTYISYNLMMDSRSSMLNNCGSRRMSVGSTNVMKMKEKAAGLSIVQSTNNFKTAIPEEAAYARGCTNEASAGTD
jgi:hypothetical protein